MNEWVDVKERLPETDHEHYIVTMQQDDEEPWVDMCFWDGTKFRICALSIVTAWMPRPEPSKPELPFYMRTRSMEYPTVMHRGQGFINTLSTTELAQGVCDRLNEIWAQDKGTKEDNHDTTTTTDIPPTDGRATRSPCCTNGGACHRSV